MTIGPPHLYMAEGIKRQVPVEIIRNALDHALLVQQHGFPPILTLRHLGYLTGTQYKFLRQTVARHRIASYKAFQISKRGGGKRVICVPEPPLMRVQKWLNQNVLAKARPHWRSFAFSPGSSILKCAQEHCGCGWLIKLDIQRFFESISEIQVYYAFRELGYQPLISFELARVCTRDKPSTSRAQYLPKWNPNPSRYIVIPYYHSDTLGHLPQGAPTSPMLANLVCMKMDEDLYDLATKNGLVYTRYADDLTFSTPEAGFSHKLAGKHIQECFSILRDYGFEPHYTKTSVAPPGARKTVLGMLVDRDTPRLQKKFRQRLKRHVWAVGRFGIAAHASHLHFKSIWGFIRHLQGLLTFAMMVESDFASPLKQSFDDILANSSWVE